MDGHGSSTGPAPDRGWRPFGTPWSRRFLEGLRRRPILCLFLLTPGLIEYIGGSSSFVNLAANPAFFLLQLGINAAMYTPGALLAREAMIRWRKGWPTVFAIGAAYAIMEEGIADQTILNPNAGAAPIGAVGVYGHFAGVNWTWLPMVLMFHILLSIAVPILLLDLALPEIRGRRLLSDRGVLAVLVLLALDTAVLTAIVSTVTHYWYGIGMLVALLTAIVGSCGLAYLLPRYAFPVRKGAPTSRPHVFFLLGALAYPASLVVAQIGWAARVAPELVVLAIVGVFGVGAVAFLRSIGTDRRNRHLVAFSAGLVVFGMILSAIRELSFPIVLLADAAVLVFFAWMYREVSRDEPSHGRGSVPSTAAPGS
ncbi:MAG: hypothetical protein ACREDK_08945 [Thermoplasmata archaeon]